MTDTSAPATLHAFRPHEWFLRPAGPSGCRPEKRVTYRRGVPSHVPTIRPPLSRRFSHTACPCPSGNFLPFVHRGYYDGPWSGLGSSRAFITRTWARSVVLGPKTSNTATSPDSYGPADLLTTKGREEGLARVCLRLLPSLGTPFACCCVGGDGEEGNMSKKNNLAKRKKQYEFDLQRTIPSSLVSFPFALGSIGSLIWCLDTGGVPYAGEKEAKEKQAKKLQAKKSKMKVPPTPVLSLLLPIPAVLDALIWLVNTQGLLIHIAGCLPLSVLWDLDFQSFALEKAALSLLLV